MTPYQSPPWRKLTELSGGKGVKAEWQDFPEEFLTITNEQASSIPCNGRAGCYMNVVRHGPSDIVGICTSDTKDESMPRFSNEKVSLGLKGRDLR